jgi:hypothetical protein
MALGLVSETGQVRTTTHAITEFIRNCSTCWVKKFRRSLPPPLEAPLLKLLLLGLNLLLILLHLVMCWSQLRLYILRGFQVPAMERHLVGNQLLLIVEPASGFHR